MGQSFLDFMGPRFYLEIDDRDATDLMPHIKQFEYKDNEKKKDELTLSLSNKGLQWQDDWRFVKGTKIKARWGYPNDMSDVKIMTVTQVSVSMPPDPPTIKITAMDAGRTKLGGKLKEHDGKPRAWGFKSSSDIAKEIAKRHGFKVDIEDSKDARKEYRHQTAAMTDVELLSGLASKLHWDMYVENGTLHFHKKRLSATPEFEFTYYTDAQGTLLEFSSDLYKKKKGGKTGKAGADPKTGKPVAVDADGKSTGESKAGKYAVIEMDKGSILMPTAETNQNVITIHARAQQGKLDMSAVKAEVTVIGTPKLTAKRMIRINGVGKVYSGVWRVEEARHVVQPSGQVYVTKCSLKRNAVGKGDKKDKVNGNDKDKGNDKKNEPVVIFMPQGGISPFFYPR